MKFELEEKASIKKLSFYFIFFCIFFLFFLIIMIKDYDSDFNLHLSFAREYIKGNGLPPNFLFYFLVSFFSGFTDKFIVLQIVSSAMLALSVLSKYLITRSYFKCKIKGINTQNVLTILSIAAIISFALPSMDLFYRKNFYLGSFPPNVWHNSTTILVFPFSLLLYIVSVKQFKSYNTTNNIIIFILLLLNIFIKPSFVFCFIPVYTLFIIAQYKLSIKTFQAILLSTIGLALIFYMQKMLYSPSSKIIYSESKIEISPFLVWNSLAVNPFISLFSSILYPLAYIVFSIKNRIVNNKDLTFAWVLFLCSVIIFILFAEGGERMFHGNFIWQCIICSFLLFIVTDISFFNVFSPIKKGAFIILFKRKDYALVLLSKLLHILFGIIYLLKYLVFKNYA